MLRLNLLKYEYIYVPFLFTMIELTSLLSGQWTIYCALRFAYPNECLYSVIITQTSSIYHDTFDTFYWTNNIRIVAEAHTKNQPLFI